MHSHFKVKLIKMPRGKYVSHKGKHRRFNNPEEIQEQMQKMQQEQEWRKQRGDASSGEEAEKKEDGAKSGDSSDESSDEDEGKAKGVQHLIQIENPNRVQKKNKKVSELSLEGASAAPPAQLSRREREELEKQKAQANYQRLHAMGKTDEARADLARLAIIKQQREEAAKRRDAEKAEREAAQKSKSEQTQKAMGKKKT
ncbi:hypothetical protein B566_EDAN008007 [Ephemera danica]|nr:hypothetical protein B566_EDAN008007 [Ephemera danica]